MRYTQTAEDRIAEAIALALQWSWIDGAHHKTWVIDQMLRTLFATEDDYNDAIDRWTCEGEYDWDEGIAP